ncbi:unnamed protein product [Prorocentrum cordatum]|uniref:Uncharacterized protein n=1 Tax=Prorocentrum cordatum TaxID=2364126 RepID=A0ABN9QM73_9DINO|nr:unnamed protein product [Polarella glacialis]
MTSVSQPARCVLTGEPLMELVVEGVGGKTGVVPLALDGVDVTARLDGQQNVDHSGPLRGEGVGHCDGESKLEGLDVLQDFGYRQPLRGKGVGRGEGVSKLVQAAPRSWPKSPWGPSAGETVGIGVPKDVEHGEPLRGTGVGHCVFDGKLEGVDELHDVDHGNPRVARGSAIASARANWRERRAAGRRPRWTPAWRGRRPRGVRDQAGGPRRDEVQAGGHRQEGQAEEEGQGRAGDGKRPRPAHRGRRRRADQAGAQFGLRRVPRAGGPARSRPRDLAIEEIEVRAAAVELAAAGGVDPPA